MTAMMTTLERSRDAVTPAIRAAVDRLDATSRLRPRTTSVWIDADGAPAAGGGGKAVRPALALLFRPGGRGHRAVGLPGAVAVELVHNFSLLHDDLMDGDVERRHRRTVWRSGGPQPRSSPGTRCSRWPRRCCWSPSRRTPGRPPLLLVVATRDLIRRGRSRTWPSKRRNDVTVAECLDMAAGKNRRAARGQRLDRRRAGRCRAGHRGRAVRLRCPPGPGLPAGGRRAGIWGDPAVTGKPVHSEPALAQEVGCR